MVAKLISLISTKRTTRPDRGQIGIQKPHFTKISSLFFCVQHVHVQQLPFSSITKKFPIVGYCLDTAHSDGEKIFYFFFANLTAKCLKVNIQNRDRKIIVKCLRVNCCVVDVISKKYI